jgi:hypothetical protein
MIAESAPTQTSGGGATIQFGHKEERLPKMMEKVCANIANIVLISQGVKIGGAGRGSTQIKNVDPLRITLSN